MYNGRLIIALFAIVYLGCVENADSATPLTTTRVATALAQPLYVTAPAGDAERLFIVEQGAGGTARIKILNLVTQTVNLTPFLTISGITTGGERGLLGLAFHPDYATNGYFFVNHTDSAGDTVVQRYTVSVDPNVADPNSVTPVIGFTQTDTNHNGGWIDFGPDGYLYIASGDGGGGGDPDETGQDLDTLLGKMLRIDVDGDDFPADPDRNYAVPTDNPFVGVSGLDEIWAYGLRNPWRNSFDRLTGDLYIADVGQWDWEEVNVQPASSTGGENYGWDCYEGNHAFELTGCDDPNTMTFPVHEYDHSEGCSITGGYVYRGAQICDLQGTYFFADYCTDTIWSFRYDNGSIADLQDRTAELDPPTFLVINDITSFGEDGVGEMYIVDRGGEIYKIMPDGPQKGDLNRDGVVGFGDINAFVQGLVDLPGYIATYGDDPVQPGDLNCDLAFDFGDINPFVALLVG